MFTGLIQALGKLHYLSDDQLKITCLEQKASILEDIELGDSIAVDGVCLTVEQILPQGFIASASPETQSSSTLGITADQTIVNLESSLRVGSKIGGHFVTGHVDGLGYFDSMTQTANAWELCFTLNNPNLGRYIVQKGSIAVNGISLTVAECNDQGTWFKVAVIPVTFAETTLQYLQSGSPVNLEGDILGKYVERFTRKGEKGKGERGKEDLSLGFLSEHGYL